MSQKVEKVQKGGGGVQGGIISGNLGTRFPGNLKVSQEILIDTPNTTQTSQENYSLSQEK